MSSIRVTRGGDVFRLPCNDTDTLLALLRRAGCTLPAACGGHGRCGKCRVSVNGVPRLACRVVPEDGDEIVLPPAAGGRILTETLDPPAVPTGETGCAAAIDLGPPPRRCGCTTWPPATPWLPAPTGRLWPPTARMSSHASSIPSTTRTGSPACPPYSASS